MKHTDLNREASSLALSGRAKFVLRTNHIKFVGELVQLSADTLLSFKISGQKLVHEIEVVLGELDLRLGMKVDGWSPPSAEEVSSTLTLTNLRQIDAVDFGDADFRSKPWLDAAWLTEIDRAQLVQNVLSLREGAEDTISNVTYDGLKKLGLSGFAEVPIEWWDLLGPDGAVVYQLILCLGDSGVLVEVGTTKEVGEEGIVQGYWHGDAELAAQLESAQAALKARREAPGSMIHSITFVH